MALVRGSILPATQPSTPARAFWSVFHRMHQTKATCAVPIERPYDWSALVTGLQKAQAEATRLGEGWTEKE